MFYVYKYTDPKKNKVVYVGYGSVDNKRAYDHLKDYHITNNKLHYTIQKRKREGYDMEPEILLYGSEEYCRDIEIKLIKEYGREDLNEGTLFNLTSGGEGASGAVRSDEHKKALSDSKKQWWKENQGFETNISKNPITKGMKGKKHSEESKQLMSERAKGRKPSLASREATTRRLLSDANPGKNKTEETCRKISEATKGKRVGSKNPSAKVCRVYDQNGNLMYEEIGATQSIAKKMKVSYPTFCLWIKEGVVKKSQKFPEYIGWKIETEHV